MIPFPSTDRRHWLALNFGQLLHLTTRPLAPAIGLLSGLCVQNASGASSDPPPPLLLAKVASPHLDVTRYLVSEKLDGVRAYWTGERLLFRCGAPVHAPAWFTERLPRHPLDGELWLARGRFDAVSGLLRQEQSAAIRCGVRSPTSSSNSPAPLAASPGVSTC